MSKSTTHTKTYAAGNVTSTIVLTQHVDETYRDLKPSLPELYLSTFGHDLPKPKPAKIKRQYAIKANANPIMYDMNEGVQFTLYSQANLKPAIAELRKRKTTKTLEPPKFGDKNVVFFGTCAKGKLHVLTSQGYLPLMFDGDYFVTKPTLYLGVARSHCALPYGYCESGAIVQGMLLGHCDTLTPADLDHVSMLYLRANGPDMLVIPLVYNAGYSPNSYSNSETKKAAKKPVHQGWGRVVYGSNPKVLGLKLWDVPEGTQPEYIQRWYISSHVSSDELRNDYDNQVSKADKLTPTHLSLSYYDGERAIEIPKSPYETYRYRVRRNLPTEYVEEFTIKMLQDEHFVPQTLLSHALKLPTGRYPVKTSVQALCSKANVPCMKNGQVTVGYGYADGLPPVTTFGELITTNDPTVYFDIVQECIIQRNVNLQRMALEIMEFISKSPAHLALMHSFVFGNVNINGNEQSVLLTPANLTCIMVVIARVLALVKMPVDMSEHAEFLENANVFAAYYLQDPVKWQHGYCSTLDLPNLAVLRPNVAYGSLSWFKQWRDKTYTVDVHIGAKALYTADHAVIKRYMSDVCALIKQEPYTYTPEQLNC